MRTEGSRHDDDTRTAAGPRLPDKPDAKAGAGNKTTLDDAALTKALRELPADPAKRADALAELARQVGDKARRDPIVKALRDLVAKIQPVMPDADARKAIDQAIDDAVEKGAKAALLALLKAVVGKGPAAVDRDGPRKDGPNMPAHALGNAVAIRSMAVTRWAGSSQRSTTTASRSGSIHTVWPPAPSMKSARGEAPGKARPVRFSQSRRP